MTTLSQSGLIQTRHPLPEEERQIEESVLAGIGQHFATFVGTMRQSYDALTAQTPIAGGVSLEFVDDDGVQGWWVSPVDAHRDRAILFIHGGAYMLGSAEAYRGFASQLAVRTGVPAFVLDYPLAPEHPFPAAYEASVAARRWLGTKGVGQIALAGDSAGGALALAALQGAEDDTAAIASVVAFSPWIDLTLSGPSFSDPATHDPIFKRPMLSGAADQYLAGTRAEDGRASPLYAVPDQLPPLAIQVGTDELLLDDAVRYAEAAAAKGGEVHLDIYEGLHHVFQRSTEQLASARHALNAAARFLSDHWS